MSNSDKQTANTIASIIKDEVNKHFDAEFNHRDRLGLKIFNKLEKINTWRNIGYETQGELKTEAHSLLLEGNSTNLACAINSNEIMVMANKMLLDESINEYALTVVQMTAGAKGDKDIFSDIREKIDTDEKLIKFLDDNILSRIGKGKGNDYVLQA